MAVGKELAREVRWAGGFRGVDRLAGACRHHFWWKRTSLGFGSCGRCAFRLRKRCSVPGTMVWSWNDLVIVSDSASGATVVSDKTRNGPGREECRKDLEDASADHSNERDSSSTGAFRNHPS